MTRLPTCLLLYGPDGAVIGSLESMVQYDDDGRALGLVDFEAHELAGGRLREVIEHEAAAGAGTWPEWLGAQAHDFRVELRPGPKGDTPLIRALVHRESGYRRERSDVEATIAAMLDEATPGRAVEMSDFIGSPGKRLELDTDGRNAVPTKRARPNLPLRRIDDPIAEEAPQPEHPLDEPTVAELAAHLGVSLAKARALKRQGAGG